MPDPHASRVRISLNADPKSTVGCALLVSPRHALTCAHVVADALGDPDRPRARRVLVQLVRPPERADEAATRQWASQRQIPAADLDLLPRLAQSRLVVTGSGPGGEAMAEIAHEALIREWGTLRDWVAEDRSFRLWQEGLRARMAEWRAHHRDPGHLLSGPPLVEALGRLAAGPEALSDDDQGFIREGRRHEDRRHRVRTVIVAAVMLILAAFGGVAAWQWQRPLVEEAETLAAADQARAAELSAQGEAQRAQQAAVRATQARSSAENLISYMTFDLRDKLQPLGKLELLRDAQQRADAYYELLGVLQDDPAVMRRRAFNLSNSGDLQLALGDLAAPERLYADAAEVMKELAQARPEDSDRQRDLSVSLERVGDIKQAQGDLAEALTVHQERKAITERLARADPSNAGWQWDLMASLVRLAARGWRGRR